MTENLNTYWNKRAIIANAWAKHREAEIRARRENEKAGREARPADHSRAVALRSEAVNP